MTVAIYPYNLKLYRNATLAVNEFHPYIVTVNDVIIRICSNIRYLKARCVQTNAIKHSTVKKWNEMVDRLRERERERGREREREGER